MSAPAKIHVVTRCYLHLWADGDGRLLARDVRFGAGKNTTAAAVGWREEWWGAGDPILNRACETACAKLENAIAPLLRGVKTRWPLAGNDRALVAQFVALHVLRTPAFVKWFVAEREQSLARLHASWDARMSFETFAAHMRSDAERSRKLLLHTNKVASSIASMHWTLVTFEEPLLVTSDQPVVGMPLLDQDRPRLVNAMPDEGWNNTVEVRFPLGPHLLLLGSWAIAPEGPPVAGEWPHAVDHNVAVLAQTDRHWIRRRDRVPALAPRVTADGRQPRPDCRSLAQDLLSGYTVEVARQSERRRAASRAITDLIERQDDTTVSIVGCEFSAAA